MIMYCPKNLGGLLQEKGKNNIHLLCDSDFLIALLIEEESTHKRAHQLLESIRPQSWQSLKLVQYEIANVISRKYNTLLARDILQKLNNSQLEYIHHDEYEDEAWKEFYSHSKKSISFVDCANLVAAKRYNLKIASFDSFYPKTILA